MWKINLAQSSELPLSALFCLPDLWMSAVSLCDPSFSERWTGGGYWWAWRVLSTPYSPAADQSKREGEREGGERGGETKEIRKQKELRWKWSTQRVTNQLVWSPGLSKLYTCHSFNRRLRPLLTSTGIAKQLVSLQYNGQPWMLSVTVGDH